MKTVPVLMYHHVCPAPGLVTVSPNIFRAHMEMLKHEGYTTLSGDTFLAYLQGRAAVPDKSVVITFDDGYLDNYLHAYPILKGLGLHAIIFVVTGWVGEGVARDIKSVPPCPDHSRCKAAIREGRADGVMLRWTEIELMQASGTIEFHSHTHRHVRWEQMYPDPSVALMHLREDLIASRHHLVARLGERPYQLCWPWGIFDDAYQDVAEEIGFTAQYSVDPHANYSTRGPKQIGRIAVKSASARWLALRLWIYANAKRANVYNRLSGKRPRYG